MFTGNDVKVLYSDMFSTYRSFVGEESIAAFRKEYGIQLMNPPPYAHYLNGEAESAIQSAKRGTRTRLGSLIKKVVSGKRILDPSMYWPYAWEHYCQCDASLANITLLELV